MATAFDGFANCVLTFQLPVGDRSVSDGGSPLSEVQPLRVRAMLLTSKVQARDGQQFGAIQQGKRVEGRVISLLDSSGNPTGVSRLPLSIATGVQASVLFDSGESGEFYYEPTIASPFFDEANILGQPIGGLFVQRVLYGEVA